jgi:hypothetical protein
MPDFNSILENQACSFEIVKGPGHIQRIKLSFCIDKPEWDIVSNILRSI